MIIGVDMGASAVKLCGLKDGKVAFTHYASAHHEGRIYEMLSGLGVQPEKAEVIAVTGLNTARTGLEQHALPLAYIEEPRAIGAGGAWLAGRDDVIVTSIGTGTAFVLVRGGQCTHIGGTGVGGGTIRGLAKRLMGLDDIQAFDRLVQQGDYGKVDLLIRDFSSGSETLFPEMTASNLARMDPTATEADWAAGILNLVLQVVGTMSMLSCNGYGASGVVVIGAVAGTEASRANFQRFTDIYGLDFLIPEHYACATAIGAARQALL